MRKQLMNLGLMLLLTGASLTAQEFSVDADFRVRPEVGHQNNNFRGIGVDGATPETFVDQRARLKFQYTTDKFTLHFSPQDVRVWGNGPSIQRANNYLTIYEAYVDFKLKGKSSLKLGRQALLYDDQRLISPLDWTMMGRAFDAAKFVYNISDKSTLDVFASYNNDFNDANDLSSVGDEIYGIGDGGERTVSMQGAHLTLKSDKVKLGVIGVNNVVRNPTNGDDNFMYTVGVTPKVTLSDKLSVYGSAYYQGGKNTGGSDKNAFQAALNIEVKPYSAAKVVLGTEILSGTEAGSAGENNSFSPLYGLNHAFNGYADFFFVGNHFNSVGLIDSYIKTKFKVSNNSSVILNGHYFQAQAGLSGTDDRELATEIDAVFVTKFDSGVSFKLGHSQVFTTSDFDNLRGVGNSDGYQGWTWAMLVFKPSLFKSKI